MEDEEPMSSGRKRLRASHACDACRARKVRCNGNTPCATCEAACQECTYGSEANSRGKSDLILEGVLRLERTLEEMRTSLASAPKEPSSLQHVGHLPILSPSQKSARVASFSLSPRTDYPQRTSQGQGTPSSASRHLGDGTEAVTSFDNAILASMHTSATESVLQWPHFDNFPGLRNGYDSIFHLEQSRAPLKVRSSRWYPYLGAREVDEILESFSRTVNFWYPTMSLDEMENIRELMAGKGEDAEHDVKYCLALLTMALGLVGQVTAGLADVDAQIHEEDKERRAAKKTMADAYFDGALRHLHVLYTHVGSHSTHCFFLIALYYAFLRRPLQAWEFMNISAARCLLLLSYHPEAEPAEDEERNRRIFWSCYILESDYLAELPALPQSGISQIESSTPLPGPYTTHASESLQELSALYFLACISMRRLLNRVHHLLYAQGTGTALIPTRFPAVVRELDHQLEEWREVLPRAFYFSIEHSSESANPPGDRTTETEAGGFLRQRYLTCRSVIYRPYLMWILSGVGPGSMSESEGQVLMGSEVLRNGKICLDACLSHILNLRGFGQTCLVDTWICALSMAGAMLMLLAACRVPELKALIGPEILAAGQHLQGLLGTWQAVMGAPSSPSVDQSLRLIADAESHIKQVYGVEGT